MGSQRRAGKRETKRRRFVAVRRQAAMMDQGRLCVERWRLLSEAPGDVQATLAAGASKEAALCSNSRNLLLQRGLLAKVVAHVIMFVYFDIRVRPSRNVLLQQQRWVRL